MVGVTIASDRQRLYSRDASFNELLNRYNRLLEALHFIRDYQGDPRNPVYTLQTVRARAGAVIEQESLPKDAKPQ